MEEILRLLENYENRLDEKQLYPKIEMYSDGSGELIDGRSNVIIGFADVKELVAFLSKNK